MAARPVSAHGTARGRSHAGAAAVLLSYCSALPHTVALAEREALCSMQGQ